MSDYNKIFDPYNDQDNEDVFQPMTREERQKQEQVLHNAENFENPDFENNHYTNEQMYNSYHGEEGYPEDYNNSYHYDNYAEQSEQNSDPYLEAYSENSYMSDGSYRNYNANNENASSVYSRQHSNAFPSESRINAEYERSNRPQNYFHFASSDEQNLANEDTNWSHITEDSKVEKVTTKPSVAFDNFDKKYIEEENPISEAVIGTLGKAHEAVNKLTGRFKKITDKDLDKQESGDWKDTQTAIQGGLNDSLSLITPYMSKSPVDKFINKVSSISVLACIIPFVVLCLFKPLYNLFEKMASNKYYLTLNPNSDAPYKLSSAYGNAFLQTAIMLVLVTLVFVAYRFIKDNKSINRWKEALNIVAFAVVPQIVAVPVYIVSTFVAMALAEGVLLFANIITVYILLKSSELDENKNNYIPNFYLNTIFVFIYSLILTFISRSSFFN